MPISKIQEKKMHTAEYETQNLRDEPDVKKFAPEKKHSLAADFLLTIPVLIGYEIALAFAGAAKKKFAPAPAEKSWSPYSAFAEGVAVGIEASKIIAPPPAPFAPVKFAQPWSPYSK